MRSRAGFCAKALRQAVPALQRLLLIKHLYKMVPRNIHVGNRKPSHNDIGPGAPKTTLAKHFKTSRNAAVGPA